MSELRTFVPRSQLLVVYSTLVKGNILTQAVRTVNDAAFTDATIGAGQGVAAVNEAFRVAGGNRARIANAKNANNPYLHNGRSDFEVAGEIDKAFDAPANTFGRSTPNSGVALYSTNTA